MSPTPTRSRCPYFDIVAGDFIVGCLRVFVYPIQPTHQSIFSYAMGGNTKKAIKKGSCPIGSGPSLWGSFPKEKTYVQKLCIFYKYLTIIFVFLELLGGAHVQPTLIHSHTMSTCDVCCEKLNKSTLKPVSCNNVQCKFGPKP